MVLADELDDIKREARTGMIDPQSGRLAADILKWQAARMTPKVYGDRAHMTVETKGGGFIEELKRVEDAVKAKAEQVLLENRDTQPDTLRAGEGGVNQDKVNNPIADAT